MSGIVNSTGARSGLLLGYPAAAHGSGRGRLSGSGASAFAATFSSGTSWHQFAGNAIITINDASTGHLFNTGGHFNTSTYKYVAPRTGLYQFGWNFYTQQNDYSNSFELNIDGDRPLSANSARGYYSLASEDTGTTDHFNNFDGIVNVSAGESVWVEAHANSADFHANLSIFYGCQIT